VLELAERLQIPVTSSFLGRGVFPTRHPQFIGTISAVSARSRCAKSSSRLIVLLLLGELVSDTSLGVSADRVNEDNLIVCVAREVFIKYHQFQHTPIDMVVDRLLMSDLPVRGHIVEAVGTDVSAEIFDPFKQDEQIKMKHVIKLVNEFVEQHRICRSSPTPATRCLPASTSARTNALRRRTTRTMGFAVPAALGAQIASGRRPLVLVGDGAFR
jgi:indolepyruvate decarboxylase